MPFLTQDGRKPYEEYKSVFSTFHIYDIVDILSTIQKYDTVHINGTMTWH